MLGWLFGKRAPETHAFFLARISNEFLGIVLGRDGLTRKSGLRCAGLCVGVINEMVMNSSLNQATWHNVRVQLEDLLVDALEANLEAVGQSISDRHKLAVDLRQQANDACRHVIALAGQAQGLEGSVDFEQLLSNFLRHQLAYLVPDYSPEQRERLLPTFSATYMQRLQQPASTYVKKHFAR